MRMTTRFRERLVLGYVRGSLEEDERILAWAHARVPGVRAPGVVLVTDRRCVTHVASRDVDDRIHPWVTLRSWRLDRPSRTRAQLTLTGDAGSAVSELSLTSPTRARSASRLLAAIADSTELPCDDPVAHPQRWSSRLRAAPELSAAPRSVRDHVRRVAVTVAGSLVLLLSLIFASPFVPGPGALTAVAGIAILAREYEWARDVHVWASRQLERFISWLRARKAALSARRRHPELAPDPERVDVFRDLV